jgi:hypothetical protein
MHHIMNTKSYIGYIANVFVSLLIAFREPCLTLRSLNHSTWVQAYVGRTLQGRMILGYRRERADNYALLVYYASSSGNFFPTL